MDWRTLVMMKKYLQTVKPFFVEGNVRLMSEWWVVKVAYKDYFLDFTIKEKLPDWDKEAMYKLVDFCFDCYCDYEWKWEVLNSEAIWRLLMLRPGSVRSILSRIYSKLEVYGKPILQEK